jgi:anaerobic C4-dicarboxylate transporter
MIWIEFCILLACILIGARLVGRAQGTPLVLLSLSGPYLAARESNHSTAD